MAHVDALDVVAALRGGVATLDALAARLPSAPRDALAWALDDALGRGWVRSSATPDCGPDGMCSTSAPIVYSATDAGRQALRVDAAPSDASAARSA